MLVLAILPALSKFSLRELGFRSADHRDARDRARRRGGNGRRLRGQRYVIEHVAHRAHEQDIVQIFKTLHDPTTIVLFAVFAVVFAPFAEETFFRVFFFNLGLRYGGFWGGAVVSGALFGIAHGDVYAALPLALGGIVLCGVYYLTRNAYASMISHALFNGLSIVAAPGVPAGYEVTARTASTTASAGIASVSSCSRRWLSDGRLGRRRRPAVEPAVAHVSPDEVDRIRIRLVVPIGMVREPEPNGGDAAARDRDVQRTRGNADEEIGARDERFVKARERFIEIAEERAESGDPLAEIFVVHRNEPPRTRFAPHRRHERARLGTVAPVLPRGRHAAPRNHADARRRGGEAREPFVDEHACLRRRREIDRVAQRLRQIELREPLGPSQQPRCVARLGVKRIRRATLGLGIVGPEQRGGTKASRPRRRALRATPRERRGRRSAAALGRDAARRLRRRRSAGERR